MKIKTPPRPDATYLEIGKQDLIELLEQPSDQECRPCSECNTPCPTHNSTTCTCQCSPDCSWAPFRMSSEAERYPIEPGIVSLVYSLNVLRVCLPCWSCEGHYQANGYDIAKTPKVWFYSRSVIYPRLISEYLVELKYKKQIRYDWQICMTYSESKLDAAFSIEPKFTSLKDLKLDYLQKDSHVIGANLRSGVFALAREYLREFES